MGKRLTESEIKQRLIEGANYKRLYFGLKAKYAKVTGELKVENKRLKARVVELEEQVETQSIQIAELQAYVFGKKSKGHSVSQSKPPAIPTIRAITSYKRQLPSADEITSTKHHALPERCACGGTFRKVSIRDHYEEDIPLPELTLHYQSKLVTRHIVEYGRCSKCGRRASAAPTNLVTSCPVTLGPNIRLWVAHTSAVLGLSYYQIAHLADVQYGLKLSDGEIANILASQHSKWLAVCESIKTGIRASPAKHYDETPWKIQSEKTGHAWVMSDAKSSDTVFELATGRGSGHIKKLHQGSNPQSVYITDDYAAYRNLSGKQQLCWAHLYRASRDLANNSNLPKLKQKWVKEWHRQFSEIYEGLRTELLQPYELADRAEAANELWSRVYQLANQTHKATKDPDKLRRLKEQLKRAGKDKLFACLIYDTPCDNNRAERDLRPLVLKRKRSFGSKTLKGAKAMSTVLSVCTTMWRRHSEGYFGALAGV
jgi:transposase